METKICKDCGRELPQSHYRTTRWGGKADVCNACINEKRAQTRYDRSQTGGGSSLPFPTRTSTTSALAKSCALWGEQRSGLKAEIAK